ncbi:MAG TPA: hypothetical protein VJ765_04005 [Chitinophagaceae bacterium]|nr:hypothetical protein [Chitinophagaceae bacterium]
MKQYIIKANALIANCSSETGLIVLAAVIGVLSYFTLMSNKIVSPYPIPSGIKRTETIAYAPNSFYDEPFDPLLEEGKSIKIKALAEETASQPVELRNGI